jgi:hypothetical protein
MEINKNWLLMPIKADTRHNDADMGTKAQKFYEEYFSDSIKCERGDTWFTPIALLENIYDIRKKIIDKARTSKLKEYKKELISNISSNIIEGKKIGVDYHCLANFGCLPSELNRWRGSEDFENINIKQPPRLNLCNRSRLGDFPDLFFICVKSYLTGKSEDNFDPEIEGKKLKEYDWWFKKIGGGEKCTWEDFVDKMHLKGSFVDDNYEVVKLFDHKIGAPFPTLQGLEEIENGYSIITMTELLSEDTQVKTCIKNIYKIWNTRAAYLEKL